MKWADNILDLVFPRKCRVCGSISKDPFCPRCFSQISYLKPSVFFHAVAAYETALKKAIHQFKFNKRRELASPLGRLMVKYINHHLSQIPLEMVIPVPLHERRLKERGYNQAALLGQEISRHFDLPTISGILLRKKETLPQFNLKRQERLKNVRGAFEVKGRNLVAGHRILLIDDIYTTGFTAAECTRALKQSGAKEVHILALARAVEEQAAK